MKNKLPVPVCTVFLTSKKITVDARTGDDIFIGLPRAYWGRKFPAAATLSMFIRCTSGHGAYSVEVQLQKPDGEIVWRDGPPEPLEMPDPLNMYDLRITTNVIFPAPDIYNLVLVLDGEEVSRQRFHAKSGDPPIQKSQTNS